MVRKYKPVGGKYGPRPSEKASRSQSKDQGKDKDKDKEKRRRSDPIKSKTRSKREKSPIDAGSIKSRKAIDVVTINMHGKGVMGLTPKYKVNMIQDFLSNFPDVVFFQVRFSKVCSWSMYSTLITFQDSIEYNDLTNVLEAVSEGTYDFHFQVGTWMLPFSDANNVSVFSRSWTQRTRDTWRRAESSEASRVSLGTRAR